MIHVKKGLRIPIVGKPKVTRDSAPKTKTVGIVGSDYIGMKPSMKVSEGESVKIGQTLFTCKKVNGVQYTAPAAGKVLNINRGAKRSFVSMVIEVDNEEDHISFQSYQGDNINDLDYQKVQALLIESGLWTAFRTRPYSKTPTPNTKPHSIFVTAMDTNPLSFDPEIIINEYRDDFAHGLEVISKLTDNRVYLCVNNNSEIVGPFNQKTAIKRFKGIHPAGNVGVHIHYVDPVGEYKTVWHISYHDVIAVGKLFKTGKLWTEKVIALGGPCVKNPRILKTRLGANILDITIGETAGDNVRIISGSILNGHKVDNSTCYLGRYHHQVSILGEGNQRHFMGWAMPGIRNFSVKNVFLSKVLAGLKYSFNTAINGGHRAMVPLGIYEKVMPGNFLPTQLLRSILVKDTDQAKSLGCLELDEEDLALCSFACPCKIDYGPELRSVLTLIEKEG